MLTNSQMRPGRYLQWATARRKAAWIASAIASGRTVYLCTQYRQIKVTRPEHVKATKSGLYVVRGKGWDCADGCALRAI